MEKVRTNRMSKPILEEKDILNPNEAIELFVLSRRKFYKLLKENRQLGFLAMYGSRKLIIRSEFQKYLYKHPELKWEEDFPGQDFGCKAVLD